MIVRGAELDGVTTVLTIGDRGNSSVSSRTTGAGHRSKHWAGRRIGRDRCISGGWSICCCWRGSGGCLSSGGVRAIAIGAADCCNRN